MKNALFLLLAVLLVPLSGPRSAVTTPSAPISPWGAVPLHTQTIGETAVLEWGCPVAEWVHAKNGAAALKTVSEACVDEVRQAAAEKPDVSDVIRVSVTWPDLAVEPSRTGFYLSGTLFLETLVFKRAQGGPR